MRVVQRVRDHASRMRCCAPHIIVHARTRNDARGPLPDRVRVGCGAEGLGYAAIDQPAAFGASHLPFTATSGALHFSAWRATR